MHPRILMLLVAIAAGAPSLAWSQEGHLYLGGGVGQGHTNPASLTTVISGVNVTAQSGTTRDNSYKLYGGYQFDVNWGLEVGYNNLGNGYTFNSAVGGAPGSASYKVDNWYVAGTGTLPLGASGFAFLAKLGLVRNGVSGGTFCSAGTCASLRSSNRTQSIFGLGAQYAFTKNVSARFEYEDYGTVSGNDIWATGSSGSIKANNWTLSLKYDF